MEVRDKAKKDWEKGMKYQQIADKYGVSLSAVKSWATRFWKNEGSEKIKNRSLNKEKLKVATKNEKLQPKRCGPPLGSYNALGHGAPKGNKNALKHGVYSEIYWDVLDDEEKSLIDDIPTDEELLLIEQIQLFAVRERRIMGIINKYRKQNGEVSISGVVRTEHKRTFKSKEEEEDYNRIQQEKIDNQELLPGRGYEIETSTENKDFMIARWEKELTNVQNKKTKAIDTLAKLRLEKQRLDGSKGNDAVKIWTSHVLALREDDNE